MMADRFINDREKIIQSKTAAKISCEDFATRIIEMAKNNPNINMDIRGSLSSDVPYDENEPVVLYHAVAELLNKEFQGFGCEDSNLDEIFVTLKEDTCFCWNGWESFITSDDDMATIGIEELIGLHTINNLTFFGCITIRGVTDRPWVDACAFFTMLYWNGEEVCLYTPVRGNRVMAQSGMAVSRLIYCDSKEDSENYNKSKKAAKYIQKYGYDSIDDILFNWDAVKEDITKAIRVC